MKCEFLDKRKIEITKVIVCYYVFGTSNSRRLRHEKRLRWTRGIRLRNFNADIAFIQPTKGTLHICTKSVPSAGEIFEPSQFLKTSFHYKVHGYSSTILRLGKNMCEKAPIPNEQIAVFDVLLGSNRITKCLYSISYILGR